MELKKLIALNAVTLLLLLLLLGRDVYADYARAACERDAMLGYAGPCTCGQVPR